MHPNSTQKTQPPQTLYVHIYTYRQTYGGGEGGFIRWHYITLLEVSHHKSSQAANKLHVLLPASICELWALFVSSPHYIDCSYIKPPKTLKMTSLCLQTNFNAS